MFEQTFKNIDNVLWKEAGCTTELDYTEQTSWMLFLKYLDDLEREREMEAQLKDKSYDYIIDSPHRWSAWAAPKKADGSLDDDIALIGDDLIEFVNKDLFPYLHGFKERASAPDTIEYKIGEIFGEIKNKFQSGYSLRDALELMDELKFRSQKEKHELSHLYEAKIKNMGNAGRNGGEYYTPRPLIRAMIQVVNPQIGERIYDGACGSAGFLCEAHDFMRPKVKSADQLVQLQDKTFYGKEKKSLAYVIAIMNMILHGIDAPNIQHTNTLSENLSDIQDKDRFDVILANPPFGGKERAEVQQNFPIKTSETAFLFLQHFIKSLKAGGRAAIVIKTTFLSNADKASIALRKELLQSCNLHTILVCPTGTFIGAGVKTVVLFFDKGEATRKIWYYQLDPGRSMGKTNPLNDDDLKEFNKLQPQFEDSGKSWSIDIKHIDPSSLDLSPENPHSPKETVCRELTDILEEIVALDAESISILEDIQAESIQDELISMNIEDCIEKVKYTDKVQRKSFNESGKYPVISQEQDFINGYWSDEKDVFKVTKPVIIFGDHTKIIKYIDFDFVLGADGVKILQPKGFLESKYFYYYLQAFPVKSLGYARHYRLLKELNVVFPKSTSEQKRVTTALDKSFSQIDLAISNAEKKLAVLNELRQVILKKAFSADSVEGSSSHTEAAE